MSLEHVVRTPTGGERKPTPVLLLHGAWHGAWCYDLWLDDFAAHGYEAHAMSLPAHGKSSKDRPIPLYSLGSYVKALERIVAEIKPTPFVVGHSMGGLVLQRYLKTHELPGAVLLCSVPPFGARTSFLHYILKHPLRFLVGNLTTRLDLMVKTPKLAAEYFLTEGATLAAEELSAKLQNESLLAAIEFGFVPRTNPRQITSPVLVVAAGRDAIIPVEETRSTAKAYGAAYVLFEDQGHSLMVERRWQEVAAEIRAWFERIQLIRS